MGFLVVEVLAAYSNLGDLCSKWQELTRLKPTGAVRASKPRPRQQQHRLEPDQVAELVALYRAGETAKALGQRFGISEGTVPGLLDRSGVERHKPGLSDDQIARARILYESGLSLVAVGADLKVNGSTIKNAFRRAGIPTRPRRGASGPGCPCWNTVRT